MMNKRTYRISQWARSTTLCALSFSMSNGLAQNVIDSTRVYAIDEVVVTGSNQALGRNLLPYTVSTVSRTQLEATGQS